MKEVGTAIIVRNNKIFIAQRPEGKPLAGLWEFPGGKQEQGESIEELALQSCITNSPYFSIISARNVQQRSNSLFKLLLLP